MILIELFEVDANAILHDPHDLAIEGCSTMLHQQLKPIWDENGVRYFDGRSDSRNVEYITPDESPAGAYLRGLIDLSCRIPFGAVPKRDHRDRLTP